MAKKTLTELQAAFADNSIGAITGADMQDYIRNSASWSAGVSDGTKPSQSLSTGVPVVINQWTSSHNNDAEAEAMLSGLLEDAPHAWTVVAGYSGVIGLEFDINMSLSNSSGVYTLAMRINGVASQSATFETSNAVDPYHLGVDITPSGLSSGDVVDFTIESVGNETFDVLSATTASRS